MSRRHTDGTIRHALSEGATRHRSRHRARRGYSAASSSAARRWAQVPHGTEDEDGERCEAPVELRERRPIRAVHLYRGTRLEPVERDVWMEEPTLCRVPDRVEAGPADVVDGRSRLTDSLAQRSSPTRASSRPFASTRRWFASTSSSSRSNNPKAVSRSPSKIASASARSTPHDSPPANGSLPRLNAYQKPRLSGAFV